MTPPAKVTVFRDGHIFCADPQLPRARAVAIEGDTIVAVGDDDAIAPFLTRADEVISLDDRLLVPGFIDAHVHPIRAGLERLRCDVLSGVDLSSYQRIIREYARAHPERDWIIGGGWAPDKFPREGPRREHLDAIVPDRPVCLPDQGHHSMWVNSFALRLAGIDKHTADPIDGRIDRDIDGRPTGLLHEGAGKLVERLIPSETDADYEAALSEAQQYLHSYGIVGWQDAMVLRPGAGAASHDTYLRADRLGKLTAKVVGALWWERDCPQDAIPDRVAELAQARDEAARGGGRYSAGTVKIMLDGVVETGTASLLEPYRDACSHNSTRAGLSFIDPEILRAVVTELDRAGFQAHFHALGDRAVRDALDAIEAAQAVNGTGDRRHQIAHLQLIAPADVKRFNSLGVIANLQALWGKHDPADDELVVSHLGEERAAAQFPHGSLARSGARLAMGSDWPVSSVDPFAAIHTAVTRTAYGDTADTPPLGYDQELTLATAINAYTAGSAWANHDSEGGRIRVGNRADLVVLDRDPFEFQVHEIGSTRVERTVVSGTTVFEQ
ncbi:amidohydrolase [Paenarthrobacter nitroguajacolicus]|uniref:amidohydrolase n=1 Tax=Paenarthrobacter nitroguajacolicus TaxID=211146 RepID=UPI003442F624